MPNNDDKSKRYKRCSINTVAATFLKGCASGMLSTAFLQPFDLLKSRLQYHYVKTPAKADTTSVAILARNIIKEEGFFSLWNGLSPSLLRVCAGAGIYFTSIEVMTSYAKSYVEHSNSGAQQMQGDMGSIGPKLNFLIGASSRSLGAIATLPITVVKTRIEATKHHGYTSTVDALSNIWRNETWGGLYRGLAPTLIRDVPFSGIYLVLYQKLKRFASDYFAYEQPSTEVLLSPHINFSIGFLAGAIATAITHPFDVIKTRIQVSKTKSPIGLVNHIKNIYRHQGTIGLNRGLFLRIVKRPLSTGIVWTVYESLKR